MIKNVCTTSPLQFNFLSRLLLIVKFVNSSPFFYLARKRRSNFARFVIEICFRKNGCGKLKKKKKKIWKPFVMLFCWSLWWDFRKKVFWWGRFKKKIIISRLLQGKRVGRVKKRRFKQISILISHVLLLLLLFYCPRKNHHAAGPGQEIQNLKTELTKCDQKKKILCVYACSPPPQEKKMFVKKNCWIFVSPSLCSLSFHFCRLGMDNWDGSKIVFISICFYFFLLKKKNVKKFYHFMTWWVMCVCRMKVLEKRKKKRRFC